MSRITTLRDQTTLSGQIECHKHGSIASNIPLDGPACQWALLTKETPIRLWEHFRLFVLSVPIITPRGLALEGRFPGGILYRGEGSGREVLTEKARGLIITSTATTIIVRHHHHRQHQYKHHPNRIVLLKRSLLWLFSWFYGGCCCYCGFLAACATGFHFHQITLASA